MRWICGDGAPLRSVGAVDAITLNMVRPARRKNSFQSDTFRAVSVIGEHLALETSFPGKTSVP